MNGTNLIRMERQSHRFYDINEMILILVLKIQKLNNQVAENCKLACLVICKGIILMRLPNGIIWEKQLQILAIYYMMMGAQLKLQKYSLLWEVYFQ